MGIYGQVTSSYKTASLMGIPQTTKERHRHPLADEENFWGAGICPFWFNPGCIQQKHEMRGFLGSFGYPCCQMPPDNLIL